MGVPVLGLFADTAATLKAGKLLKEAGYKATVIPKPNNISSECKLLIRFDSDEEEKIKALLGANNLAITEVIRE